MSNRKSKIQNPESKIRLAHSPDPDDAFMFYALASGQFDTAPEVYEHHLSDIETLNRAAERGQYEVTALSFHAYAHVAGKYVLLPHGASFGVGYGPVLVARQFKLPKAAREQADKFVCARQWLSGKTIAVPGERTSALLALRLFAHGLQTRATRTAQPNFQTVAVPFDQIIPQVAAGNYDGGLIIHEGQLTYHQAASGKLKKVVDLGAWWSAATGLPLPLGCNAIRKDLGAARIRRVSGQLRQSVQWGLEHRQEALGYALKYGRGLSRAKADKFVGMYVNEYTLDYGEKGRKAVRLFLDSGRRLGLVPAGVEAEWSE
ncbi:MAG: MqnA/MqnD/SBP family protein [Planctomycetota bacterium]